VKIAVCIKRVPVMEVKFAITADGSHYDTTGLKYDINDFDLWAIEAALQLKEQAGAGSVHVVCLGPNAAQEQIRKAMAMGADSGTLLETDTRVYDGLAVARALAAELRDGGYDLLLGLPVVTNVFKLDIRSATGRAERVLEGASEVVEFPLPAVLTIDDGLNKERLPSLKGIMAAKKKPLEVKAAALGEQAVVARSMALPPERAAGRIVGEGADAVPELVRLLQTEAKVL
jgi:electron transfer flavoprotein beta subunit